MTEIAHVLPCRIVNGTCTEKHMRSDEKSSYLTGTKVMRHMCVISTRTILVRDADSIEFLTLGSEAFPVLASTSSSNLRIQLNNSISAIIYGGVIDYCSTALQYGRGQY